MFAPALALPSPPPPATSAYALHPGSGPCPCRDQGTPFHLKVKLANCYTFLLVFGYYGLAGFVTKGTYQLRDYRTLAASAQWLLATNLVTVLLSEHWNPRFMFGQSKSVSREIKQTVPADEADADADADAPPPATPPAAEQLSNTVTHVASV